MSAILACVDGSDYDASVCEYAAWLAGVTDTRIDILCAPSTELNAPPSEIVRDAFHRLRDLGAPHLKRLEVEAPLTTAVAGSAAMMAVLGKRGASDDDRDALGSNAASVIAAWNGPVCLAARVFLPVNRAVVLLDDVPGRRVAIDFLLSLPGLSDLDLEVAVVSDAEEAATRKVAAAKRWLSQRKATVTHVRASGLADALDRFMRGRAADVYLISRAVLFPDDETRRRRLQGSGFWTWRSPVLIC